MCLAVPAEVVSIQGETAVCRVGSGRTTVKARLMLLPKFPTPGEFLLIHAGFALRVLDREQAEESLRVLRRDCTAPAVAGG